MTKYRTSSNAPIFWGLFGAGGMLSALFGPALIILTGFMIPHGWGLPADFGDFPHALAFARHPIGKLVALAVIALFFWHGAERMFLTLKDMRAGDIVQLHLVTGDWVRYRVTIVRRVPWNDGRWTLLTSAERLTLQTCTSWYTTADKFVVVAVPVA